MHAIAAALKKAGEVHYLLEIDFGGLVKRWAAGNISVPPGAWDRENLGSELVSNTGFETAGAAPTVFLGWTQTPFASWGTSLIERVGDVFFSGACACKITRGNTSIRVLHTVTVSPGATYKLSFWTQGSVAGRYSVYDVTGAAFIIAATATGITGTAWQKFQVYFTAPAGCVSVRLSLYNPETAGYCYYDEVSIKAVESPTAGPGESKLFHAAILNAISVGSRMDLNALTYSLQNVAVSIANKERLQDEERRRRLDGGAAKIYIWCDGLTWADIEPDGVIMQGVFSKTDYDRYRYDFALAEQVQSQFPDIPGAIISADTWPNHRIAGGSGSVAGLPQQMVFGDWAKGVPLLCVDTAGYKYLAMAGLADSADADYTAATKNVYNNAGAVIAPANYTFYPGGIDDRGNAAAYFDFTSDQTASEPLSCGIRALQDGDGSITGTAGAVVQHPADIVYYLMRHHTTLGADKIDVESLKTMRALLPGLKFAAIINTTANVLDVVDRILAQCRYARIQRRGKIGVAGLHVTAPELSRAKPWGQIGKTVSIAATPDALICNSLTVKYALNPTTKKYESALTCDRTNNALCKASYYQYGPRPAQTVDLPDVQDDATAAALANRRLELLAFRHDIIERETTVWEGFDVLEGDCGLLTCPEGASADAAGWTDEPCILLDRKINKNTITQRWWRIAA